MLSKKNRLTTTFDFNITKKYGKRLQTSLFYVYDLKPTNYTGDVKIGIVLSNKFDKRATFRNRFKRQIREIVKNNIPILPKDHFIVIYPRNLIKEKTYEEINFDLTKILQEISLA